MMLDGPDSHEWGLFEPGQYAIQVAEEEIPTVVGPLVIVFLIRAEAGLLHPQERPVGRRRQGPRDDRFEAAGNPLADVPFVRKTLPRLDGQDLTIDDSVPLRHRISAKLERAADDRLKVVLQPTPARSSPVDETSHAQRQEHV